MKPLTARRDYLGLHPPSRVPVKLTATGCWAFAVSVQAALYVSHGIYVSGLRSDPMNAFGNSSHARPGLISGGTLHVPVS